ncbi:hypothetical protein PCASD_22471, partial [Puccinia coronata f. sp. avenae]
MAQDGFAAYDCTISQPVLVHSVVLCFLADSPMHAEVTNTPNPGQSNHPCRMCTLSVERKSMVKSKTYIQKYLQVDEFGLHSQSSKGLGRFDGVLDTPVEILHVVLLGVVKYLARDDIGKLKEKEKAILIGRLDSLNCLSMNINSIKAKYLIKHIKSLVGRHFKVILQSAPFVLLDLLSSKRWEIWLALCKMCVLIFQTRISKMDSYINELTLHINQFICLIIKSNAHWVKKAKLHMLLHLPQSIRRFGPASLFSTEKFESYNGVLQKASIHSNRLSP